MDDSNLFFQPWVYGPLASLGIVLALFFLKVRVFRLIQEVAARTTTRMDDLLLSASSRHINLLIVASGLFLLGRILPLPPEADRAVDLGYTACIVVGIVWFMDRMARGLLDLYAERIPFLGQTRSMIQGALRGLFVGVGVLILLDSMGISIAPLLASLGVGSLAVALALQGTLANLFAGVHLLADRAVEPGHWIRLDTGQEGAVIKIGWRSTRIRTQGNVVIIVPNAKLVDSVIMNFDLPDPSMTLTVPVLVHYTSDLAAVERVTLEVARDIARDMGNASLNPEPAIRVTAFADSGISLAVHVTIARPEDQAQVRHELLRRLHERYRREGIALPYPTRTLDVPERVLDRLAGGNGPLA